MVKLVETEWDTAKHLRNEKEINAYLKVAFDSEDPKLVIRALGNAVRARGMLATARKTGLNRAGLYSSFTKNGDPKVTTFYKVIHSLGHSLKLV